MTADPVPYIWMQEHEVDDEKAAVADCGCAIFWKEGHPAFDFCDTHKAAPDMLKALRVVAACVADEKGGTTLGSYEMGRVRAAIENTGKTVMVHISAYRFSALLDITKELLDRVEDTFDIDGHPTTTCVEARVVIDQAKTEHGLRAVPGAISQETAEKMLQALLDLNEWDAETGRWESPCWARSREVVEKAMDETR